MKKFFLITFFLLTVKVFSQESITKNDKISLDEKFFDAETYRVKENYDKSNELLFEALNLSPKNDAILFKIAQNYYDLKNYVQSQEFIDQAIQLNQKNKWYQYLAIEIAIAQKRDTAKVRRMIEDFRPLAKNKFLINSLYLKLFRNQKKTSKKLSKKYNANKLILDLFQKQQYSKVITIIEKSLVDAPTNPQLYLWAAQASLKTGNAKKTLEYLDLGIDFARTNKKTLKQFYQEYIKVYQTLKKPEKVKKYQLKLRKI